MTTWDFAHERLNVANLKADTLRVCALGYNQALATRAAKELERRALAGDTEAAAAYARLARERVA